MVMLLVIAGASVGIQQALSGTTEVLDELPQAVQRLRVAVTTWQRDGQGPLSQVRKTADELQKLAGATTTGGANPAPSAPPAAAPASETKTLVVAGTAGMAIFIGQLVSVLFLTYFLLAAGDLFRRRLMQAMGPALTPRKKALQTLDQIHKVSQRYFALVLAMNIAAGTATWAGLFLLDVRHPAFWGIAMAILHTIPYLGAATVTGAVGLIAYLQDGERRPCTRGRRRAADSGRVDRHLAADGADGPDSANERPGRLRRAAFFRHAVGRMGAPAGLSDHGHDQDRVWRNRAPEAVCDTDGRLTWQRARGGIAFRTRLR